MSSKVDKTQPKIAKKGLIIAHIGDGKGKTTAAIGLAVRAAGAGLKVLILQFVKAKKPKDGKKLQSGEWPLSSEIEFLQYVQDSCLRRNDGGLGQIDCEQVGEGFVGILGDKKEREIHIKEAIRGLERAREIIISKKYDLIILDEILSAVELDLLKEQDVIDLISYKPENLHLVITGHKRFKKIFSLCDTVTEMKMLKHAYYQGVLAQKGIDY